MVAAKELAFRDRTLAELRPDYQVGVDPLSGAASLRVVISTSPGRRGLGPEFALTLGDDGVGGVFGVGTMLAGLPFVGLDVRDGLPRYDGADRYVFAGQELVPTPVAGEVAWSREHFDVTAFRPRVEQSPLRVERWTSQIDGSVHFRVREPDGSVAIYGASADGTSRIAEHNESSGALARVWRWLLEAKYDGFGNGMFIRYAAEDDREATADERRMPGGTTARYPVRVLYGNRTAVIEGAQLDDSDFAFVLVFDYGDHANDSVEPNASWTMRTDPVSTGAPGFLVRTRRLCRRLLMFHRFPERLGEPETLVRVVRLGYHEVATGSLLETVESEGVRNGPRGRTRKRQPVVRIRRRAARIGSVEDELPLEGTEGNGDGTRIIDLFGVGLPGLFTESPGGLFYAENLGQGRFGPRVSLPVAPTQLGELGDFDGDGNIEALSLDVSSPGYFRLEREAGLWQPFRPLPNVPRLSSMSPQRGDIDGDGRSDLVFFDAAGFTWFRSLGEDGFELGGHVALSTDRFPSQNQMLGRLLADMNGDGLPDVVEVQNGSVRYWPNLGRGHFGEPVEMLNAPRLDYEGAFDSRRLRLVDLTGTGACDLAYLADGEMRLYRNARGASFLDVEVVPLPAGAELSSADIIDILGEGTPCLVWRSTHGAGALHAIRLLPDGPPGTLDAVEDGMGATHLFTQRSSALEYRRDVDGGRGWHTRLPMHRFVVTEHQSVDGIGGRRLGRSYEYHDGHYDCLSRQFVGFLHVDELDVTSPDVLPRSSVAAWTRKQFHPGDDKHRGSSFSFDADAQGPPVVAALHELTWPRDDHAWAYRALAGALLRTDVHAMHVDGPDRAPLSIALAGYEVERLGPATPSFPRGSFRVLAREQRTLVLESTPTEPRVNRSVPLIYDDYGFLRTSAEIGCGRAAGPAVVQGQEHGIGKAVVSHVHHVDTATAYVLGSVTEQAQFELLSDESWTGISDLAALLSSNAQHVPDAAISELTALLSSDAQAALDIYNGNARVRLLTREQMLYWRADLAAELRLGTTGVPVLPHHTRQAAFWSDAAGGQLSALGDPSELLPGAGYTRMGAHWWRDTPTQHYDPASEFYALLRTQWRGRNPRRYRYDDDRLALVEVTDEARCVTSALIDYQALAVERITDANGAVSEVRYDALGVVVARSAYGEVLLDESSTPYGHLPIPLDVEGPTFADAAVDPDGALHGLGARYLYELGSGTTADPARCISLIAERFQGAEPRAQAEITYLDAFGAPLQIKRFTDAGSIDEGPARDESNGPRWLALGFQNLDAKGQLVRESEPFFTRLFGMEFGLEQRDYGAATHFHYDALGRQVREDYADGSFSRTEFESWRTIRYDANDTLSEPDAQGYRDRASTSAPAAEVLARSLEHINTPTTLHLDALGRTVATVELADDRDPIFERTIFDGYGEARTLTDGRELRVFEYERDLLGRVFFQRSVDAGDSTALLDAFDQSVIERNTRGAQQTRVYDDLGRLLSRSVRFEEREWTAERLEYGDPSEPESRRRNACGLLVSHRDSAGLLQVQAYDPFGNVLTRLRQLSALNQTGDEPVVELDWTREEPLEAELFHSSFVYDALGRALEQRLPDGVARQSVYRRSGQLAQLVAAAEGESRVILRNSACNARGQQTLLQLGDNVRVEFGYSPDRFQLQRRTTFRSEDDERELLSDVHRLYDPTGRLSQIVDRQQNPGSTSALAMQGVRFDVTPPRTFEYDFRYQLKLATGRVHRDIGGLGTERSVARASLGGPGGASFNDGGRVSRYEQAFSYDRSGNLTGYDTSYIGGPGGGGWAVRKWVSARSNRSLSAELSGGGGLIEGEAGEGYFDSSGNLAASPYLRLMQWNADERLRRVVTIAREDGAFDDELYQYASDHQRVRKLRRRLDHGRLVGAEIVYLDGCELRRDVDGGTGERQVVSHFVDENGVSLGSWYRAGSSAPRLTDEQRETALRVHVTDHLGSTELELGARGQIIVYEESFVYGQTALVAGSDVIDPSFRTLRFTGKEQDEVTGWYYFQHRYYAAFVGNWLSPDPISPNSACNAYIYVSGDPVNYVDYAGLSRVPRVVTEQHTEYLPDGGKAIYITATTVYEEPSELGLRVGDEGVTSRAEAPNQAQSDGGRMTATSHDASPSERPDRVRRHGSRPALGDHLSTASTPRDSYEDVPLWTPDVQQGESVELSAPSNDDAGREDARAPSQREIYRPYGDDEFLNYVAGVGEGFLNLVGLSGDTFYDASMLHHDWGGGFFGAYAAVDRFNPLGSRVSIAAFDAYTEAPPGEGSGAAADVVNHAVNPFAAAYDLIASGYARGHREGVAGETAELYGVLFAVDAISPVGALRDATLDALEAIERGDSFGAGRSVTEGTVIAAGAVEGLRTSAPPSAGAQRRPRLPRDGDWTGEPGNSGFRPRSSSRLPHPDDPTVVDLAPDATVPFVEGRVDFGPFAVDEFDVPGLDGSAADATRMALAVARRYELGGARGLPTSTAGFRYMTELGVVPHHAGGTRVQLVPHGLHGSAAGRVGVPHSGGASQLREIHGTSR